MSNVDYSKKTATIVKATPKLVDDLLKLNTQNRNIKKGHLRWIVAALQKNEFHLTTQAIGVSGKGVLLDGQHRLMAIKEAGYPSVELLIVTGLDEAARVYIDQGAKRSIADMLKIVLNQTVSNKMAAMVNRHLMIKETKSGFSYHSDGLRKPSLDSIVEATETHLDRILEIIEASGNLPRAGSLAAFLDYSLKYDHDAALELACQVNTGENLTKSMPAYRLRQYFLGKSKQTGYGSAGQLEDYKVTVAACLAHSRDEDMNSLRPANSWEKIKMRPSNYPKNMIADKDGKLKKSHSLHAA